MQGACADLAAARSGEQIQGYAICIKAQHGCANEALNLFELMKTCGIASNHITFLGVLTTCSHGGLVEEGLR
ncbi:hypothetical protein ACFX2J_019708 [Malus domestica]